MHSTHSTRTLIATIIFGLLFSFTAFAFTYNPTISFTRDLKLGMKGDDVKELQIFLNNNGFTVSSTDSGSIGKESVYFGKKTKEAVIKFQEKYKTDILEPLFLKNGTGLFYKATRDFINKSIISIPVITVFIPQTTSTTSTVVNIPQVTPTSTQQEITVAPTLSVSKTYTIIYNAENGGSIKGSSSQIIKENATGTEVTAVADSGYYFIDWSDGVTSSTRTDSNLTENKNVNANFGYRRRGSGVVIITAVENNGINKVGEVLTADVLPLDATVIYQWQSATTSGGEYSDITDATSSTYTLTADDFGKYIKVVVTGVGSYSGEITSDATDIIFNDIVFTYNGSEVTYGVIKNPMTGLIWLDRNLGASRIATSPYDSFSYGDSFQWGRGDDGHQLRTSGTTNVLSDSDTPGHANFILVNDDINDWRSPQSVNLWQGVDGINNPCPDGFRIPTESELLAEKVSWSSNDIIGAFETPLKWTLTGFRYRGDGAFNYVDSQGRYWSNNTFLNPVDPDHYVSSNLMIVTDTCYMASDVHSYGASVRCIKD